VVHAERLAARHLCLTSACLPQTWGIAGRAACPREKEIRPLGALARAGKAHVKVLGRSAACSVQCNVCVVAARSEIAPQRQLRQERPGSIEFTVCITARAVSRRVHACRVNQEAAADGSDAGVLAVRESHAGGLHGWTVMIPVVR
jgi:hypothetical protein